MTLIPGSLECQGASKKLEPMPGYCERLDDTVVSSCIHK